MVMSHLWIYVHLVLMLSFLLSIYAQLTHSSPYRHNLIYEEHWQPLYLTLYYESGIYKIKQILSKQHGHIHPRI